jgi:hypothetical protein
MPPHYQILHLELRRRPTSREHARPQPPAGSRRYGGGAEEPAPVPVPVGVTGHRPPNPAARGPSWTPRTTPSPTQLLAGPRGRTAANIAASGSGPSDRAAGRLVAGRWSAVVVVGSSRQRAVSSECHWPLAVSREQRAAERPERREGRTAHTHTPHGRAMGDELTAAAAGSCW